VFAFFLSSQICSNANNLAFANQADIFHNLLTAYRTVTVHHDGCIFFGQRLRLDAIDVIVDEIGHLNPGYHPPGTAADAGNI
jgi:hypothetical protein